jgi:hypothetical protein
MLEGGEKAQAFNETAIEHKFCLSLDTPRRRATTWCGDTGTQE